VTEDGANTPRGKHGRPSWPMSLDLKQASKVSWKREGEAQQDKAAALRDVAAKEAEAEKARAEASAAEAEQRSHQ
jgi:hypothetical protein